MILLSLLLSSQGLWAGVSKEQRALLAIVDLAEEASKHQWMYRLEGKTAVKRIHRLTDHRYSEVVVHAKKEATFKNFLSSLKGLMRKPELEAIDVIVYVHGKNPSSPSGAAVCFVGTACTPMEEVTAAVRELSPQNSGKLRMLYSDACWGSFHMQAWLAAGFKVVNGSVGVDANHSADLRRFLKAWGRGASYEEAMRVANGFWLTPLVDRIVKDANSEKLLSGDVNLRIDD